MRDFEEKQMERWDNTSGYNYNDRGLALSAAFPALMRKVYTWMTLALAITAITAYGVASSPALLGLIYSSKFTFFGLIIAELALVFYVSARIDRLSLTTATLLFILYSIINGATLASIFAVASMEALRMISCSSCLSPPRFTASIRRFSVAMNGRNSRRVFSTIFSLTWMPSVTF